jgi:hypothetical protein
VAGSLPNGDPFTQREFALYREFVTSEIASVKDMQNRMLITVEQIRDRLDEARHTTTVTTDSDGGTKTDTTIEAAFLNIRGRRLFDQMIPALVSAVVASGMLLFAR